MKYVSRKRYQVNCDLNHNVAIRPLRLMWVDFGASARRADGKQEGDSLELATRIEQRSRSEIMRDAARMLLAEARATLESAAATNQDTPAWLVPFLTPAGWQHYEQLKASHHRG
jgi:hypothetical protein